MLTRIVKNIIMFLFSLGIIVSCAPASVGAIPQPSGEGVVSLGVDKTSFDKSKEVIVHVTITNPNDHAIKVLKWFTPLERVERSLFTVLRDGQPVAYVGPLFKRTAPTEQDYVTLEAGASLSSDVNLSTYYDLSVSGNYQITYSVDSIQLYAEEGYGRQQSTKTGRLTSNTLNIFIK